MIQKLRITHLYFIVLPFRQILILVRFSAGHRPCGYDPDNYRETFQVKGFLDLILDDLLTLNCTYYI